ncbi:MAG TPA: hypothetical protein PK275_04085 [Chitinophagaceae bacterium]|nr:hypothetical protein [Chitinophagaceae bacterium]
MNDKHVLFIEDGDITEQVNRLRTVLKKQGITLVETIFNLNEAKFRKENAEKSGETILDFEVIKTALQENFMLKKFDYVMCDFYFNDQETNGFRLVKWLKNVSKNERKFKIRSAKFSLYSSEKDKYIKELLSEEEIGNLIKLKLEDFYDRTRIAEDFGTSVIHNLQELNLKEKFVSELDKYKDMKFQSGYPKFKDMTLNEIASEIEDDTHHGIGFQEALIELTIAHLINLNKE